MTVRFKKTEVNISFFFATAVTVISMFDRSNMIILNMLAAICHETGHFLCMILLGEAPERLDITPFGMRIQKRCVNSLSFSGEALCAVAGPAVNFIIAAIFCLIDMHAKSVFLQKFIFINIIIGILNMLPCQPLDGSRILYFCIVRRLGEEKTEKILKYISAAVILPVAAAGFYVLIKSGYNFSLLLIAGYLSFFLVMKKE